MEMKNICGKIPVDLHEKMKLEIEELGISIPKYLEMVIEEHMTRKGEKTNMADLRTVAVQVTEDPGFFRICFSSPLCSFSFLFSIHNIP